MRALSNWLDSYLEYTSDQEAPEKLHLWAGFAIMAAALRRQVYMDRVFYKLFPNIYVLIVAESARVRKSVAMDMSVAMLREAVPEIMIMTGSTTPEGLIKHMNRTTVIKTEDPKHPIIRQDSHVLIHADELATLFGYDRQRASRMAILLTEVYSSKDQHTHTTAKDGQVMLHNLYPTLLAATDPRNLKVLPEEAIGGLIGRLIIVTASQKRKQKTVWEADHHRDTLQKALIIDLARISSLTGIVTVTPTARELFSTWYDKQSALEFNDPFLDAFHERAHDSALKLSMLLSISMGNDLVVTDKHMMGGIHFIEQQMPEFSRVVNWAGASVFQQNRARLIDLVRRSGGVSTRRIVLRSLKISSDDLTALESTLVQEGTLTATADVIRKEVIYKLSVDEMQRSR